MCTLQFVGDDGHTKVQKFSIGKYIFLYDIPVIAQEILHFIKNATDDFSHLKNSLL